MAFLSLLFSSPQASEEPETGSWFWTVVINFIVPLASFFFGIFVANQRHSTWRDEEKDTAKDQKADATTNKKLLSLKNASNLKLGFGSNNGKAAKEGGAEVGEENNPKPIKESEPKSANETEDSNCANPELFKVKSLCGTRAEDLEFYRTLIGHRTSFQSLMKFFRKKSMYHEARFIAAVNKIRRRFVAESRGVLRVFFGSKEELGLEVEGVPALKKLAKKYGGNETLYQDFTALMIPRTAFDAVEQNLLLKVGDILFPKYREKISGFLHGYDMALKNTSMAQVQKMLYNKLWEEDPDLVSILHHHPAYVEESIRAGVLRYKARSSKKLLKATFRIQVYESSRSSISVSKEERKLGVLDELYRFALVPDCSLDPIMLQDAEVTPDASNPKGFSVTGPSAIHPKKRISCKLVALDEEDREKWVKCLRDFKSSPKNIKANIANFINILSKYAEALRARDMKALTYISEMITCHLVHAGISTTRATVPMAFRYVLFKSAGKNDWDDEAFRECMGWLMLMAEVRLSELQEADEAQAEVGELDDATMEAKRVSQMAKKRHWRCSHKPQCIVS